MEIKPLITDYLAQARMMQVATAKNNQPWVCTVYFVHDDNLNLYWISKPNRRHSEEIRNNEKAAGVIVLPHMPGDDVRGLQFEGKAHELSGEEAREALKLYAIRYKLPEKRVEAILNGSDGHVIYRIHPSLYVLFDEVNFPKNPRQEYPLHR